MTVYFAVPGASNLATTLGQDFQIQGLVLTATASSPMSIGGSNTLTLGSGGITLNYGSGGGTISTAVALGTSQTWTNDSTNPLSISGPVSGGYGLTVAGSGVVILSGSDSYSGTTTISGGTLVIGNGGSGESLASPTIVDSGTLAFNHGDALTYGGAISGPVPWPSWGSAC